MISLLLLSVAFGVFVIASLFDIETFRLGNLHGYFVASVVGFGLTFFLPWISISKIKVLKPAYIALLIWFGVAISDLIYFAPKAFSVAQQLDDRFDRDVRVGIYGVYYRFKSEKEDASTGVKLQYREDICPPYIVAPPRLEREFRV